MKRALAPFLLAAFVLAGCSATPEPEPTPTQTEEIVEAEPTPTATPTPEYATFEIVCDDSDYDEHRFFTYQEAWSLGDDVSNCDGVRASGSIYTDAQQAAFEVSQYEDISSLTTLYGICAEADFDYVFDYGTLSEGQMHEIKAALLICPDHPRAADVQGVIDESQQEIDGKNSGTIFGSGIFRVGDEIQPGTYVSEGDLEGCYWARLDSAGNIIDNNFLPRAQRVEVTISASDYSFSSESCGMWHKQ